MDKNPENQLREISNCGPLEEYKEKGKDNGDTAADEPLATKGV